MHRFVPTLSQRLKKGRDRDENVCSNEFISIKYNYFVPTLEKICIYK